MAVETETEEVAVEEKAKIDWKNLGHKLAAKIPRINLNLAKKPCFYGKAETAEVKISSNGGDSFSADFWHKFSVGRQ